MIISYMQQNLHVMQYRTLQTSNIDKLRDSFHRVPLKYMALEPLFHYLVHVFVREEEIAKHLGVSLVDEDVVEKRANVRHEGNPMGAKIENNLVE